jgi:hypothetical protein
VSWNRSWTLVIFHISTTGRKSPGKITVNPSTSPFERIVMEQNRWFFEFTCHKTPAGATHAWRRLPLFGGVRCRKQMFCCILRDCWEIAWSFLSYDPQDLKESPSVGPINRHLCLHHRNASLGLQHWCVWNWEGSFVLTAQLPTSFKARASNGIISEGRGFLLLVLPSRWQVCTWGTFAARMK